MILKKRLNQLLVQKQRGNVLLEGVIHYISLTKQPDFSFIFPAAADMFEEGESI